MLPDFGAMRADLQSLVALIERGVIALETIAVSVEHSAAHPHPEATPVFEGHLDPESGVVTPK